MIDTLHLQPPDLGPRSNPVLFGIAEAIAALLPPIAPVPCGPETGPADDGADEGDEAPFASIQKA